MKKGIYASGVQLEPAEGSGTQLVSKGEGSCETSGGEGRGGGERTAMRGGRLEGRIGTKRSELKNGRGGGREAMRGWHLNLRLRMYYKMSDMRSLGGE